MAEKGRYLRAMGLESRSPTSTELTPEGAMVWAASKVPAAVGGKFADWVYVWANKKWPYAKRGADFTGGVCVVVGAYGLQVLVTRFQGGYSGIIDKFTDGMIGRISPVVWGLLSGMFESDKSKAERQAKRLGEVGAAAGGAAGRAIGSGGLPTNGLDGDRESVRDVAALLRDSPETTQQMADQMFAIMREEGVKIDDAGRQAVVTSMRQAATNFASDNF